LAILILRVCLGIMFMAHGIQLALGKLGGPGIGGFSKMLGSLGFQPPVFWAYIGAYVTLLGGLFLILGLFTRISAAFLLIFILVAGLRVHLPNGFFLPGGFEYTFIIASVCVALIILGSGKFGITAKL